MDNNDLYRMLTSTLWQDYKGYKRGLGKKKSEIWEFIKSIFLFIFGTYITVLSIMKAADKWVFCVISVPMAIIGIYGLYIIFRRKYSMSKVNKVAFDIELSSVNRVR